MVEDAACDGQAQEQLEDQGVRALCFVSCSVSPLSLFFSSRFFFPLVRNAFSIDVPPWTTGNERERGRQQPPLASPLPLAPRSLRTGGPGPRTARPFLCLAPRCCSFSPFRHLMAQRLPSSAWSASTPDSSPSSRRRTDSNSPVEEVVYPLTRPTSSTSLAQERLAPTLPQVLSNQRALYSATSFTTAVSSSDPPQLASRTPNHANSPSAYSPSTASDELAFQPNSSRPSLPHPPPLSPLPDSLSALSAEPQPNHPASMPNFFRRRSNSVSDVPSSSATRSNSFFGPFTRSRSRKLVSNPSASASTSDLPLISSPLFPQPPPRPLPLSNSPDPFRDSPPARSPMERGMSVAIGPKAGARLLASREAQRAMRKADEVIVTADGEEFSIRETVPWREDGRLSTVTGAQTEAKDERGRDRANSSSGAQSKSSSQTNHSIKRVPVPPLDPAESRAMDQPRREKSIHDLTRRASQEEELTKEDEEAQRRRKASLSKASGAGLGSPFAQSPSEMSKRPHRRPPVAGLNSKAEPSSASNGGRSRRASTDSTASISKDEVLGQLADAIKKERKRAEAYKRECEQGEGEVRDGDSAFAASAET